MPLSYFACENCGFWQRWFATPPDCPVCTDPRNALPEDGWRFVTSEEVEARSTGRWMQLAPDLVAFHTDPPLGLNGMGWLLLRPEGNVAFEAAPSYTQPMLDEIARLGGIAVLAASHAHGYGALWRLQQAFQPQLAIHTGDLSLTKAFDVTWPYDEPTAIAPGLTLHPVGGHYAGQAALHDAQGRRLFCGDMFKVDQDAQGRAVALSAHKAYHKDIPLTPRELRRYRDVIAPLAFDAILTPFEYAPEIGRDLCLEALDAWIAQPPRVRRHLVQSSLPRTREAGSVSRGWDLPADAPPPVRMYRDALPGGRYAAFSMTPIDRTGVPAWKAALFLDDGALLPGAMPSGYGYGATDAEALTGAVAEIAEMIAPTLRLQDVAKRMGSYADLARELGSRHVADPLTLGLPAGSPVDRDTPLAWIAAVRAATQEPVWVPMDVGALDYFELPQGYTPFTTLITNGLGAGPDLDWAIGHGLYECLQRDGNGLRFRALDAGVLIDLPAAPPASASDDLRETLALIGRLEALGITVLAKFATDEFGLCNVYVTGFDRAGFEPAAPIMLSACGEACDPDRDRALRKAVLEFCSARVRKAYGHGPLALAREVAPPGYVEAFLKQAMPSLEVEESRALREMTAWAQMSPEALRAVLAPVYAVRAHKRFDDLPQTVCADARVRGALARARLEAAGLDVLYVDCSPRAGGCAVVKVIVPGLEVETMSYHRIGERNTKKLIESDSPLVRFGPESATLRTIRLAPEAQARLARLTGGRTPRLDVAAVDATVGALYPLYREPEAHHVAYRLGQVAA